MVIQQLQTRVDELEKLFDAHRLRPEAHGGGIRLSREALEFDADALLRMVDNLEHNMKQSMVESVKGRLYDRYMEKREARLRDRWGSQGRPTSSEERFGETRAQKNEQFGGLVLIKQRPLAVVQSLDHSEQDEVNFYQSERVKYGHGTYLESAAPNDGSVNSSGRLLHRRSSSFTTTPTIPRPSTSSSTNRREKSQYPVSKSGPLVFLDLRKENLKPTTGISKVNDSLSPRSFLRSKSSTEGPKDLKEEKVPRPQHRRIQSFGFSTLMNSDNPSPALSRFSKEKSVPHSKSLNSSQSKPFLRRGSGIGPGAGASIAKMRALKASEIQNNEEEYGEYRNRQSGSELEGEESIISDGVKLTNDAIMNSDALLGNQPSYAASQSHVSDNVEGSTSNHAHPLCVMREANAARVRKKWASAEKLVLATDAPDKPLKDVAKAFKKLLKFGRKNKSTESAGDSTSTSTVSEDFYDMDDHHGSVNQPSDDIKRLRMGYLASSLVGSY